MALKRTVWPLLPTDTALGEGPVWDAGRSLLWFVDIKRSRLWRYDPKTAGGSYMEAPGRIGWALPTDEDTLLCGLEDGLYVVDPDTHQFDKLTEVPDEPAGNRLNDACTDTWGRVWFGSMDDGGSRKSGRFYVYDRGEVRQAGPSLIEITNGPAVNAAGDRIYFTDTLSRKIFVAHLTREGVSDLSLFVETGHDFPAAFPDGSVVDSEDHVWVAMYMGGALLRFSPDGKLVDRVLIPARDVTKMAFGGADFTTVYVTSANKDMTAEDMQIFPDAGRLFAFNAGVSGFAQPRAKLG